MNNFEKPPNKGEKKKSIVENKSEPKSFELTDVGLEFEKVKSLAQDILQSISKGEIYRVHNSNYAYYFENNQDFNKVVALSDIDFRTFDNRALVGLLRNSIASMYQKNTLKNFDYQIPRTSGGFSDGGIIATDVNGNGLAVFLDDENKFSFKIIPPPALSEIIQKKQHTDLEIFNKQFENMVIKLSLKIGKPAVDNFIANEIEEGKSREDIYKKLKILLGGKSV